MVDKQDELLLTEEELCNMFQKYEREDPDEVGDFDWEIVVAKAQAEITYPIAFEAGLADGVLRGRREVLNFLKEKEEWSKSEDPMFKWFRIFRGDLQAKLKEWFKNNPEILKRVGD